MKPILLILLITLLTTASKAQTWEESTLATLTFPFGYGITSGLLIDSSGNLYATGPSGKNPANGAIYKIAPAGTATEFYDFSSKTGYPTGILTRDSVGNLYGTTGSVVYKVSPAGKESTLHTFAKGTYTSFPVHLDSANNVYGYFYNGTAYAIFKLTPKGVFSVLHTFLPGNIPNESLTTDSAGNFYGTASGGSFENGFVFKMTSTFKYSVLHNFTGGSDGGGPTGRLVQKSGLFYGTTLYGGDLTPEVCSNGSTSLPGGCGIIFSITSTGTLSPVYTFTGSNDGWQPYGALTLSASGNLYGVTLSGSNSSYPSLSEFEITPTGIETKIGYVGSDNDSDGLAIDKSGNIYGTSNSIQCCSDIATIYKLTKP